MRYTLNPISDALGLGDQGSYSPGICNTGLESLAYAAVIAASATSIGSTISSALNQPDIPVPEAIGPAPTEDNQAARLAAAEEKAKDRARARQANVLTSPLGVLQSSDSLAQKTLLGGGQ